MKKYICPNCGFKGRLETRKDGRHRWCKNCNTQVYSSKVILESMLRTDILKNKFRAIAKR